ncbi:MAG: nitric oxide reductase NorD protein, partial [Methanolobus sp.]|nr:nitric oxide reductase NorD protein [Methanolobus sp.]
GARTKMLVLLSDGEPYDRARGEDSYQGDIAQEDTRMAISEGKNSGMHFFCITVDKNPGEYLNNIFSDVGYTIIDDALMLPEMLPLLYKRLTT